MPSSADIQAEDKHQEDTTMLYSDERIHLIDPSHRLDDIIRRKSTMGAIQFNTNIWNHQKEITLQYQPNVNIELIKDG
jgi:hypothetical protein